jgi:hypothetical protein
MADELVSVSDVVAALHAPRRKASDLILGAPPTAMQSSGLYAIYGDERCWGELGLRPFDDRPLYVGKAESGSLLARDVNTHLADGRTGSSTLRRSLAALLRDNLNLRAQPRNPARPSHFSNYGLEPASDQRLTAWMIANLELAVWPYSGSGLSKIESAAIERLCPPLNLTGHQSPWSALIKMKRSAMAREAKAWKQAR